MGKKLTNDEKINRLIDKETSRWRRKFKDNGLEFYISFTSGFISQGVIRISKLYMEDGKEYKETLCQSFHGISVSSALGNNSQYYFNYTTQKLIKEFQQKFLDSNEGLRYKLDKMEL